MAVNANLEQQLAEAMKEREAGEQRIDALRKYLAATLVERDRLMEALSDIEQFTNGYGDVAGIVHKMARAARQAPAPPAADTGERP